MSSTRLKSLAAVAALAAGCGVLPAPEQALPPEASVAEESASGSYRLLGLTDPLLHLAVPAASSCKNTYFPASHVTDGNARTAWAPNPADPCPSLTFDLGVLTCLDCLSVKASGTGLTMDVAVQGVTGGWTTIKTGLKPTSGVFVKWMLGGVLGGKVKLTFHGRDILICGVDMCGKPKPLPVPSIPVSTPTPLPIPSIPIPSPFPIPSVPVSTPTPLPLPSVPLPTPTPLPLPSVPVPSPTPSVTCGYQVHGKGNFHVGFSTDGSFEIDVVQSSPAGDASGQVKVTEAGGTVHYFPLTQLVPTPDGGFTASGALSFGGTTFESFGATLVSDGPGTWVFTAFDTHFSPLTTASYTGHVFISDFTIGNPCGGLPTPPPIPTFSFPPFPPF